MEGVIWKIVGTLATLALTTVCAKLGLQIKKYKALVKKEEDETVKKTMETVLSTELKTVRKDITNLREEVLNMQDDINGLQDIETNFSTRIEPLQEEIEAIKDDVTEILLSLKRQGIEISNIKDKENNLEEQTKCAWRYRIRVLCHAYITRGYITTNELDQLQEMFALYEALGGNGQTKELYQKTIQLEVRSEYK